MTIKFPTSGVRVSQGLIYSNLTPPPPPAKPSDPRPPPTAPPSLEDAPARTHPQDHGWST
jgi:hypothetical protein